MWEALILCVCRSGGDSDPVLDGAFRQPFGICVLHGGGDPRPGHDPFGKTRPHPPESPLRSA